MMQKKYLVDVLPAMGEFLSVNWEKNKEGLPFVKGGIRLSHVRTRDFSGLYLRWTKRFGFTTLDIASVTARHPGKGCFKRLITDIRTDYHEIAIYVECVQTSRFKDGLKRMGFVYVGNDCYFLTPLLTAPEKRIAFATTLQNIRQAEEAWQDVWGLR